MTGNNDEFTYRARKTGARRDLLIGVAIIVAGLVMSGVSMMQLAHSQGEPVQVAQQQTAPAAPVVNEGSPAESKPGGTRPTTPAPEPAQPDADAQKAGAQPALPPAPAEKVAPPLNAK